MNGNRFILLFSCSPCGLPALMPSVCGFSIEVVRENPKKNSIHLGGINGRAVLSF